MGLFVLSIGILFSASFFFGASGVSGACERASADDIRKNVNSRLAPINPEFLKYRETRKNRPENNAFNGGKRLNGGVPSPVDLSHTNRKAGDDNTGNAGDVHYPSYYDLRREDNRVTHVKDQHGFPACWIFAAFASLESCLLPVATEPVDFSEWHMAKNHGFDYTVEEAGNSYMTTAYLIRWHGPVNESTVPYADPFVNPYLYYPPVKHVQQAVFLPERNDSLDNGTIKYFITAYGPVDFAYMWVFASFNDTTNAIYTPNNGEQNHRLAIVGWDDNYPAGNFLYRPPGDGAFICRNSWGDDWAEGGYCYISYYDASFQHFICFNNAVSVHNYSTIYQHDPLGQTRTWGGIESWGANVFTADDNHPLEAVGFYAVDGNMNYEISIYKNVNTDGGNPTHGTLAASQTGALTYAGYYTIKLDTKVPLLFGETFSVVVKFRNSSYPYSVPIEAPIYDHSSGASALRGQSYVSEDGIYWDDLIDEVAGSNVCIKAYSEYKQPDLALQVERKSIKGWIIVRYYAEIDIQVQNINEVTISKLEIYRNVSNGAFELLHEVDAGQLVNGAYNYQDKYLDRGTQYSYRVVAYDGNGLPFSTSVTISI
ncbi:MAG: hypothetical protein GY950_02885 [bacterium]|nr:hypothetical protein [bacterium]